MKKKILLTALMVVAFIFAFVVSAFAEDIVVSRTESEEYGTVIQLSADPGLDNASQYVSTLKKINDAGTDKDALSILTDGTYFYVFPTTYINIERADGWLDIYAGTTDNPGLAQAMAEFNSAMLTNYYDDYVINGSGTDRRLLEVVRFSFPTEVTTMRDNYCCIRKYPKLVELRFKQAIDLSSGGDTFKGCTALKTVVGFENMDPTKIKATVFTGCSNLESVKLPTNITRIPNSMFSGCGKLTITNLSECTQLTTIGSSAFKDSSYLTFTLPDSVTTIESYAFQSAFKTGGSLTINPTSNLQTIGDGAFQDCRTLSSIYIPSTVTSIGSNAFRQNYALTELRNFENCQITEIKSDTFAYASALTVLKLPRTVTTINSAFVDNNNLTLVYIPDTVTSIADTFTGGKPTNAVYIYTGKNENIFANCTKFAGANVIAGKDYDPSAKYTGINLVIGYSNCEVYNGGVHGAEVNSFEITSYLEPIKLTSNCSVCDFVLEANGQIPALFECLGYSAPENGIGGISIGYRVNSEAIEEYETKSGKTVNYGLFVGVKDVIGTGDILDENGDATQGVVKVAMPEENFLVFSVKIVGFGENQKDTQFAFGAYVIAEKNGTKEIGYMQEGTKKENDRYVFTSFNEVVALVKSKEQ